jgi:hypothetical protein
MQMHEVTTQEDVRAFLELPLIIYENDRRWIRPLDKDIEEVFDPNKNKFFKQGECARWLLHNTEGKAIGRIAAFVNKKYKNEQPTGGVGFFECVQSQQAAQIMFDHCKNWLKERGMEAMDGPINFGERDKWWGLQVEGFEQPLYGMNYNPSYYQQLFEGYGFKAYFHQICFSLKVRARLQDKFYNRHEEISKDKDYKVVHIRKNQLEKFAKDFAVIYNKAWASHGGGKTLDERQTVKMFQTMKPVMDEQLIWFTYCKEEPIAFWINLPDLNQYFKKLNGKFGLMQKLYFLYLQKLTLNKKCVGLVFGVIPEFQGKGIDHYMIVEASTQVIKHTRYEDYEMQWIGDFNPKMINIAENLGTTRSRKLTTYRYLFDRAKEFKRHPML